jgi:ABC-type xylose transport system permease subunit
MKPLLVLSRDEAIELHTRSLATTAAALHHVPIRSVAAVLAGRRTRYRLNSRQRHIAQQHRLVITAITAAGFDDIFGGQLEGFLTAYAETPSIVHTLAA